MKIAAEPKRGRPRPNELTRCIDWKQGLAIAIGVPLLILPSIGYTAGYLWSAAIVLWGVSVLQSFAQNLAFGELATLFPKASGLPGFAQHVFTGKADDGRYGRGKFIGGFSAWSYWFGWAPIMAVFTILIADYLQGTIPELAGIDRTVLSLLCGVVIYSLLVAVNSRGLASGARTNLVLAIAAFVPLIAITVAPLLTGHFHLDNITADALPPTWTWDLDGILVLLGLMGIALWSAGSWEAAAIYGPQYKRPGSDIPKALFVCGTICLFTFVFVQASVMGTLGVEKVISEPVSPLLPMAKMTFGEAGGVIMVIMLVVAMVLVIQTAYLCSAMAMHSMALEGNLPRSISKLNRNGIPLRAMVAIGALNLLLITLGTPTAILAASALGYTLANSISLFAYWKASTSPEMARLERPFKAPRGWKYVAVALGLFNAPLCLIGIMYLNGMEFGPSAILAGTAILALYVPIWMMSQNESREDEGMDDVDGAEAG